jgi:hypothetical protein
MPIAILMSLTSITANYTLTDWPTRESTFDRSELGMYTDGLIYRSIMRMNSMKMLCNDKRYGS